MRTKARTAAVALTAVSIIELSVQVHASDTAMMGARSVGARTTAKSDLASRPSSIAPGRFERLRMGSTTARQAQDWGYLGPKPEPGMCPIWPTTSNRQSVEVRSGKVIAYQVWGGGFVTTKGLRAGDSLAKMRDLYPGVRRTQYVENMYRQGTGWWIWSVYRSKGWLDIYTQQRRSNSGPVVAAAVRSVDTPAPMGVHQDGC